MRTKIAVLAVVLGLIAVQAPSMADVMYPDGTIRGGNYTPEEFTINGPNGLIFHGIKPIPDSSVAPVVETPVAPATAAVQTAARVSVNPADALPINANNIQNLEPGMNFVDMQCIKIAPSALLPKAF